MKFIELIDNAISIINNEIDEVNDMYEDRYLKMINYLEKLKVAYKIQRMNKKNICLSIVRMIDHGDSDKLQNAITQINTYYQENIYEE